MTDLNYTKIRVSLCVVALWIGCFAVAPSIQAAGKQQCLFTEVPVNVSLPGQQELEPGLLQICTERYTPASGMHEISIGGQALGRYMSRKSMSEGTSDATEPFFLFDQSSDRSNWRLHALAVPDRQGRLTIYEFGASTSVRTTESVSNVRLRSRGARLAQGF